jgi:hypothetical protein
MTSKQSQDLMRAQKARRGGSIADAVIVKEHGNEKSLHAVLADGRSSGQYKLQGRGLQEVSILQLISSHLEQFY